MSPASKNPDLTRKSLRTKTVRQLFDIARSAHPVDLASLDDYEFRGTALGMPRWVERLSWITFKKTFHRDPTTGHLRGWNVRLVQDGCDGWTPVMVENEPKTFGHYRVVSSAGRRLPPGIKHCSLIDYGLGGNALLDPMNVIRDPLVSLSPHNSDRLLGWSFAELPGLLPQLPTYFLLERDQPLTHVHFPSRTPRKDRNPKRLAQS